MEKLAVLLGDMNLFRCFTGTEVTPFVLHREERDLIRHSRYYAKGELVADPGQDPDTFLSDLIRIGKGFTDKPALFNCNDGILLLISRHREELEKYYRFLMPPQEMVEAFVDKTRFQELAQKYELPTPRTVVSPDIGDAEELLRYVTLPCVFKPDSRHYGWGESALVKSEAGGPQKALRADTPEDFARLLARLRQYTGKFLVQQYIPGGDECTYSFHAYLDRYSHPLGYFVGRKIRNYPKDCGLSSYLELCKDPGVEAAGLEILRKLNFVGPVKLDFRKDARDGALYLLELNARNTLWNHLGAASGVNIPLITWNDLNGESQALRKDYRTDIRWLAFGNDYRAFLGSYRPAGDLTWMTWLKSYKGSKVYDLFAWDDPLPCLVAILQALRNKASSLRNFRLRRRNEVPVTIPD